MHRPLPCFIMLLLLSAFLLVGGCSSSDGPAGLEDGEENSNNEYVLTLRQVGTEFPAY